MGTSLSGLTPATTFDGLLKTSDNDGLTTTKKTIGTGDGNDSQLKLATNSTQIGNIEFVSANVIATVSPSTNLRIVSGGIGINGDYSSPTANTRLHIKGSGATPATTSLLVQNSAGTQLFRVRDDNEIAIGSAITIQSTRISAYNSLGLNTYTDNGWETNFLVTGNGASSKVGIGETTPTARLHVKGSGNTNTTTSLLVQNSDASASLTYDDSGELFLTGSKAQITLKRDGGGGGVIGNNNGRTYFGNSVALVYSGGKIGINQQTPTAQLQVKGDGATSATTALLVQNSAGTELFKVNDAGQATASGGMTAGYFSAGTSILGSAYARVRNTKLYPSQSGTGINIQADATNNPPDASAVLQADSTTQGFLPPRMTTAQKTAITSPAAGLMVYDTDQNQMNYYNGSGWIAF